MTSVVYEEISIREYTKLKDCSGNYRVVDRFKNGNMESEHYYINGNLHREGDKPAYIGYYKNGKNRCEQYYVDGTPRREGDKPVYVWYYPNGNIEQEQYLANGKFHRENGAAVIEYYKNGTIQEEKYWIFDFKFSKKEYCSKKFSLIRNMLLEVKDLDLKQKLFESMYKVNR